MSNRQGAAQEYARAYFMLTEELSGSDSAREDMLVLRGVLEGERGYLSILDTPALSTEERLSLIDGAFGTLDAYLVNLIKILAEKRLSYLLPDVIEAYLTLYDESRGIVRVEAISAVEMTEEQLSRLTKKLSESTGKTIIISNTIDPSTLGGVKLRYMGIQLDGSLKTRLDGLAKNLRAAAV